MVWGQPASLYRDAQIESLKKEVEMLRAEMEKIKLEVKPGRGAADVGERGVFWCCSMAAPVGCSRSEVLAPSAVFWRLSPCQNLTPDADGEGTHETCPSASQPTACSGDRVAAGADGTAFMCISWLLFPNHTWIGMLGRAQPLLAVVQGCPQVPRGVLQAQRYITQLKAQVNSLEGEVEEQRKQKQKALVDNEQLRDELERLQRVKQDSDRSQRLCAEAESRCPTEPIVRGTPPPRLLMLFQPVPEKANATEIRYTKLKEKHSELINIHAELLRKVTLLPVPGRDTPLPLSLCYRWCGLCVPSPNLYWSRRPAPSGAGS